MWRLLPNQHLLVFRRGDPGELLLPRPRTSYSEMSFPTSWPGKFTSATLTAVYIRPRAEVKNALDEIYTATNALSMKFSKDSFIVAGDFDEANFKRMLPKYHQHVFCPRGLNILDHCYTTKDAYCSTVRPHIGKSDHNAASLLPAHKQKLKREDPACKVEQCWSVAVEQQLWDSLKLVEWTTLKNSVDNLDEYATTVMDFISNCIEDRMPK
eukprot:g36029.t1